MSEPAEDSEERGFLGAVSRRDFGKAIGGLSLLGGASAEGVAEGHGQPGDAAQSDAKPNGGTLDAITAAFTPSEWQTIGPFQYQRRDIAVGALVSAGGADDFAEGEVRPDQNAEFQSAFAGGSEVTWTAVQAEGSTVAFPQARREIDPTAGELTPLTNLFGSSPGLFDDFQDWFGIGASLYGKGYAFTTFEIDGPKRAVLKTNGTVWLNGQRYDESPVGVRLEDGTNYLLASTFLILGFLGNLNLEFRPPRAPVEVNRPAPFRGIPQNMIVPDLEVGETTDLPASVRVTNTTGRRIEDATLSFAPDSEYLVEQTVSIEPPLAPFETRRINTRVATGDGDDGATTAGSKQASEKAALPASASETARTATSEQEIPATELTTTPPEGPATEAAAGRMSTAMAEADNGVETLTLQTSRDVLDVRAVVTVGTERDGASVEVRVADRGANRLMTTFESDVDGSVQYFTFRRPANFESSSGPYDVVFSLHGANVNSWNQAGANIPREDAYVVAPDARGPVNYDHEDLGRVDDLEALSVAKERFDLDENRVYISGHSMGGHGTWHIGLTNSELFAAMAPSSGWTDHETYITVVWGRDKLHTYPGLKAVREKALQKNLAMPKTANARDGNLPIFVLHGGKDSSVPTMQPRSYVRALGNKGLEVDGEVGFRHRVTPNETDVAFLEVPKADHYWDKNEFSDETIGPGKDTVNHPDMFRFLRAAENDPYPSELTFFTTNLRIENSKHWITVVEQEQVHAPTRVTATVGDDGLRMTTENVAKLEIDTRVFDRADGSPSRRLILEDGTARLPGGGRATVDLAEGVSVSRGQARRGRTKDGDQYGPLREIHQRSKHLVYGTQGTAAETAVNRNLANLRSQRLVTRARAPATVIPDTAVDRRLLRSSNLILFGRPQSNAVYDTLEGSFPITVRDGRVRIGSETHAGDLAVSFIYPNPRNDEKLVQVDTGTSLEGLRLTRTRDWTPTQVATADYMVFDESIRYQKWNACRAAGFFDKHWRIDDELGVQRRRGGG
ncbi:MAG: prolyl oligopeptidase family serine peptidase [Halobacteriaceae archaeon]